MAKKAEALLPIANIAAYSLLVIFTRRDIAYILVIIWAFAGIAANQKQRNSYR